MAFPNALKPIIDHLDNVLVIKDGIITHSTLEAPFNTLDITTDQSADSFSNTTIDSDKKDLFSTDKVNSFFALSIGKNVTFDIPLYLFIIASDKDIVHRTEIDIDHLSSFPLIEYVYADNNRSVTLMSQSRVQDQATLSYTSISNMTKDSVKAAIRNAVVKRYGKMNYTHAAFASGVMHQENNIYLVEDYARGSSKTVALTTKTQEALIKTLIEHRAPFTEGFIEHYGVANDASTLLFEGTGKINKGMRRSNARQSNKGIVIGDTARLDANPFLLIDEYDVEASHGAAIGKIDEDQLYYLMSRGLDQKAAERLIIQGYLAPLNNMIDNDHLKSHIEALLNDRIQ